MALTEKEIEQIITKEVEVKKLEVDYALDGRILYLHLEKSVPKIVEKIAEAKELGRKEAWELMCEKCVYDYDRHSCNHNPVKLTSPKTYETCPLLQGKKESGK